MNRRTRQKVPRNVELLTELLARLGTAPEIELVGTHGFAVYVKAVTVTHEEEAALRNALSDLLEG